MSKLAVQKPWSAWVWLLGVAACGGDHGSASDAAGSHSGSAATAGSAPIGASAAGRGMTGSSADGGPAAMAGNGGSSASAGAGASAAAGRAGATATAGRAGAGGCSPCAGTGATAGRSGAAAGRGGASAAGRGGAGGASANPGVRTVVDATIVVKAGTTFDGAGKRFIAGAALGDGSQSESQKPVFRLEAGATLMNVVLGSPAADGIHCYGDATLENIVWEDIGEDALTIKESGTVTLNGGSATNGSDKVFQINAASTFKVSNFRASHAGKFIRQNGGTTFRVDVVIDACDIAYMDEAIFRTDSTTSTVVMNNTRYSMIGTALFMGVNTSNITSTNNTKY